MSLSLDEVDGALAKLATIDALAEQEDLSQLLAESIPVPGLRSQPPTESTQFESVASNIVKSAEFPEPSILFEQPALRYCQTSQVADVLLSPYNAVGKLVFRTPGGGSAHGSAWICGPQMIATVAHNLYDGFGGISKDVHFLRGLDAYGPESPDRYRVLSVQFHPDYRSNATNADVALCRVERLFPSEIRPLTLHPVEYADFDQFEFRTLAYPGHAAFDFGQIQWECQGRYLYAERGDVTRAHCPVKASTLGPGCSGGPWISQRDGRWVAIGLCSGPSSQYYNPGRRAIASTKTPIFDQQTLDSLFSSSHRMPLA